jgi:hypothetical protein
VILSSPQIKFLFFYKKKQQQQNITKNKNLNKKNRIKTKKKMKKEIKFADNLVSYEATNKKDQNGNEEEEEGGEEEVNWREIELNSKEALKRRNTPYILTNLPLDSKKKVQIRVIFLKLGGISTKNNTFNCEAFMEATWIDKHFTKMNNKKPTGNDYNEAIHWNPRLYITNVVSSQIQDIWYHIEETSNNEETTNSTRISCQVAERRRFKGEFSQIFNLLQFPIDLQELCLNISSLRNDNELELEFNLNKLSSIDTTAFTQSHEWILEPNVCDINELDSTVITNDDDTFSSHSHSQISISICVRRKAGYYYWNIYFLILIISSICLCSFSINCKDSTSRLTISIIILLTLVTFKYSLNRNLPLLPYLTSLDHYSIMHLIIVFIQSIYYSLMGHFSNEKCNNIFNRIDNYFFYTFVGLFIGLNLIHVIRFVIFNFRNNKILKWRKYDYHRNSLAKRARIKSIFQYNSNKEDQTIELD